MIFVLIYMYSITSMAQARVFQECRMGRRLGHFVSCLHLCDTRQRDIEYRAGVMQFGRKIQQSKKHDCRVSWTKGRRGKPVAHPQWRPPGNTQPMAHHRAIGSPPRGRIYNHTLEDIKCQWGCKRNNNKNTLTTTINQSPHP
jgi:hypothetical protein